MSNRARSARKRFTVVWLVILFCGCTSHASQEAPAKGDTQLKLTAVPSKQSFQIGERVILKLRLKNLGPEKALVIKPRLSLSIWVQIEDLGSKKEVKKCSPIVPDILPSADEFHILAPGATIESQVVISCHGAEITLQYGYDLSKPGSYEVRANYTLIFPNEVVKKIAGDAAIVTNPVDAAPVRFRIVPPP